MFPYVGTAFRTAASRLRSTVRDFVVPGVGGFQFDVTPSLATSLMEGAGFDCELPAKERTSLDLSRVSARLGGVPLYFPLVY
jgi:hypothetical protein